MNDFTDMVSNRILWISVSSWFVAQLIKVLLEIANKRRVRFGLFISSGGMPSSHTSFVVAMSTSIGITSGFNSDIFAVSSVISLIVMYDAAGVRRAAGKQAEVINMLVGSLENQGIKLDKKLKELLGHSPIEVFAGAALGVLMAVLLSKQF